MAGPGELWWRLDQLLQSTVIDPAPKVTYFGYFFLVTPTEAAASSRGNCTNLNFPFLSFWSIFSCSTYCLCSGEGAESFLEYVMTQLAAPLDKAAALKQRVAIVSNVT